jgi:CheY-like chemotaxis protein
MKCPRCQSPISSSPDPSGALVCPSCGARLRSKAAAAAPAKARATAEASARGPEADRAKPSAAALLENPNATLPPGTPLRAIPRPGSTPLDQLPPPAPAAKRKASPAAEAPELGWLADERPEPGAPPPPAAAAGGSGVSLDALLDEIRALRRTQDEILALLRERPARDDGDGGDDPFGFGKETPVSVPVASAPLRSRRRKSVLILDDDAAARQAAVSAFERAEVPVRAFGEGNAGLQALAEERCDVLILELGMGGAMGGKDVVNLIKATMEWVDIPIVLYTRLPVQGQKEARQIHGADELVTKAPGSEEALVSRVIQLFRRP